MNTTCRRFFEISDGLWIFMGSALNHHFHFRKIFRELRVDGKFKKGKEMEGERKMKWQGYSIKYSLSEEWSYGTKYHFTTAVQANKPSKLYLLIVKGRKSVTTNRKIVKCAQAHFLSSSLNHNFTFSFPSSCFCEYALTWDYVVSLRLQKKKKLKIKWSFVYVELKWSSFKKKSGSPLMND